MNRELSRTNINLVTGAAMIVGAALAVVFELQDKLNRSEGSTTVYGWEVLLVMLIGAAPGWILHGVLMRRFHPETHGDRHTRQPRQRVRSDLGARWRALRRLPLAQAVVGRLISGYISGNEDGQTKCSQDSP